MSLYFSFVISSIGLAYFVYGKKAYRMDFMLFGGALMIYPYFVKNLALAIGLGLLLVALPILRKRLWH